MTIQTTGLILAWVAIVLLAFAMSGLLRQIHALKTRGGAHGDGQERLAGPSVGAEASSVPGLVSAEALGREPTALLFVGGGCSGCERVLPTFADQADADLGRMEYVAVCSGEEMVAPRGNLRVLPHRMDAFRQLQVPATPYAVLVDAHGAVAAAAPVGSPEMLQDWLHSARERITVP